MLVFQHPGVVSAAPVHEDVTKFRLLLVAFVGAVVFDLLVAAACGARRSPAVDLNCGHQMRVSPRDEFNPRSASARAIGVRNGGTHVL